MHHRRAREPSRPSVILDFPFLVRSPRPLKIARLLPPSEGNPFLASFPNTSDLRNNLHATPEHNNFSSARATSGERFFLRRPPLRVRLFLFRSAVRARPAYGGRAGPPREPRPTDESCIHPNLSFEVIGSGMVTVLNSSTVTGSNYGTVAEGDRLRFNNMRIGFLPPGTVFSIRKWSIIHRARTADPSGIGMNIDTRDSA